MQVFTEIELLKSELARKASGESLVFVPTMGALHEGHLSLISLAKTLGQKTIVSIFVNPLQFNNKEDLKKYPRDIAKDKALLEKLNPDYLFTPFEDKILKLKDDMLHYKPKFTDRFEGEFRPGHFDGVCSIVNILFSIIKPDLAIFGEKDFQQLRIIEEMIKDLSLNVKIVRAPTMREKDGLAMSSRNQRLDSIQWNKALSLSRGLSRAKNLFLSGTNDVKLLLMAVQEEIAKEEGVKVEYAAVIDEVTFEKLSTAKNGARIILAAEVPPVRLIDNVAI